MWVQMLESISGGRSDGRPWPIAGHLIEVSAREGEQLIRSRLALRHPPPPDAPPEPPPPPPPPVPEAAKPPESSQAPPLPVPDEEVPVPAPSDPKADWVAYAVSQGAAEADAVALTKNQLQQAYGGRLLS